jgi:hypothetical protein
MYRADLVRLRQRTRCETCGEPIEAESWAYVDGAVMWHRGCRAPIVFTAEDLVSDV